MVETTKKHSICNKDGMAYVGDDTGLLKHIKVDIRRNKIDFQVKYKDPEDDPDCKQKYNSKGHSALSSKDNQQRITYENDVTCKLVGKSGAQVKDQGIVCLSKVNQQGLLSYVRGKSNIVEMFSTARNEVVNSINYSSLLEEPIKGLSVVQASCGIEEKDEPDLAVTGVTETGQLFGHTRPVNLKSLAKNKATLKELTKEVVQVKGKNVRRAITSPDQKLMAIVSKDTTLQLWDVSLNEKPSLNWHARNVSNDELCLQVPIFDTDVAFLDGGNNSAVCSTAFGKVRQYDFRQGRRTCSEDLQVLEPFKKGSQCRMLTHIAASALNPHYVYVVSQEGHPMMLDRRFNFRVCRKMAGAKGSVRDFKVVSMQGEGTDGATDFLFAVGCDRHLRVFDATRGKTSVNFSSTYLKQKLNSIVFV